MSEEKTNPAALVKAADAKVAIPDVNNIRALARDLLASGLFPGVKSEAGAVTIIQAGYELGIPPVSSLNTMVIINGRLAMEAKLLLAVAASRVGVSWKIVKEDSNGCEIVFSRPGFSDVKGEFTREDAKKANLLGKANWNLYEKDMFFARAAGRGIKRIAPDAILGMVTKEEAEELVDFNAPDKPAVEVAAELRTSELDELKKRVEALTGAIGEAAKKPEDRAPLPDIKDEFTEIPDGEPKAGPEDFASVDKVEKIGKLVGTLAGLEVEESKVWANVSKKLKEKFNFILTDTRDLTELQADEVIAYLNRWVHKVRSEKEGAK